METAEPTAAPTAEASERKTVSGSSGKIEPLLLVQEPEPGRNHRTLNMGTVAEIGFESRIVDEPTHLPHAVSG